MNKKTLILALSLMLIFCVTMGVTLAYLNESTDPVVNTFVAADFADLSLGETGADSDSDGENEYLVVPGVSITKDPKVTFKPADGETGTEAAYVFLKMTAPGWNQETENKLSFYKTLTDGENEVEEALSFDIDGEWSFLKIAGTNEYIFYRTVAAGSRIEDKSVIAGDTVVVSASVTEAMLDYAVDANGELDGRDFLQLTFQAYAIQQAGFVGSPTAVEDAWEAVS